MTDNSDIVVLKEDRIAAHRERVRLEEEKEALNETQAEVDEVSEEDLLKELEKIHRAKQNLNHRAILARDPAFKGLDDKVRFLLVELNKKEKIHASIVQQRLTKKFGMSTLKEKSITPIQVKINKKKKQIEELLVEITQLETDLASEKKVEVLYDASKEEEVLEACKKDIDVYKKEIEGYLVSMSAAANSLDIDIKDYLEELQNFQIPKPLTVRSRAAIPPGTEWPSLWFKAEPRNWVDWKKRLVRLGCKIEKDTYLDDGDKLLTGEEAKAVLSACRIKWTYEP